ncbi:hypothetical protein BH09ACT9_BH09ACT9_23730 [soil metagenome]
MNESVAVAGPAHRPFRPYRLGGSHSRAHRTAVRPFRSAPFTQVRVFAHASHRDRHDAAASSAWPARRLVTARTQRPRVAELLGDRCPPALRADVLWTCAGPAQRIARVVSPGRDTDSSAADAFLGALRFVLITGAADRSVRAHRSRMSGLAAAVAGHGFSFVDAPFAASSFGSEADQSGPSSTASRTRGKFNAAPGRVQAVRQAHSGDRGMRIRCGQASGVTLQIPVQGPYPTGLPCRRVLE